MESLALIHNTYFDKIFKVKNLIRNEWDESKLIKGYNVKIYNEGSKMNYVADCGIFSYNLAVSY